MAQIMLRPLKRNVCTANQISTLAFIIVPVMLDIIQLNFQTSCIVKWQI